MDREDKAIPVTGHGSLTKAEDISALFASMRGLLDKIYDCWHEDTLYLERKIAKLERECRTLRGHQLKS
jgi:hypothetical protein